jgi:hypothetical protein
MPKRIILQSSLARDGLVIHVDEHASQEGILKAAQQALAAAGHDAAELQLFDEADDEVESRKFADNEQLHRGKVFHAGRCVQVQVTVRYAGRPETRHFPPAARIGRVRRWAIDKFGISDADANELVLQFAGSNVQPTRDQHVGSFVDPGTCNATFDLVRTYTVNGDADLTHEHAALLRHLEEAPFLMGEMNHQWRLRQLDWPYVYCDVLARDGRSYTLRLQCDNYPNAPTGAFWDPQVGSWLVAHKWPRTGARFGAALRSDWQGGTALYIPCDRQSLPGHEVWLQQHPAWAWDPKVGLARYLTVVWTMLNGDDYVAPAA